MMKKRFLSMILLLTLAITPVSAAFSDISDSRLEQTASVLDALGIMEGMGNNRFSPDTALTRAQFCKLAVTAMGFADVTAYGSYTIFPDVKNTHWAAQYINAAVRHPDLKEQAIIRGYADGTFGPDKPVNFGEVCTMLLRMLGYTEQDVGPFWPADYIARAQSLGLTDDVALTDAKATVTRADAATLLLNTLGTPLKGGDDSTGGKLLDKVASATVENCILLATSDTDASLLANEAIFYENGAIDATPRKTAGTLDQSLIGTRGTLVIGKEDKSAVGIVPDDGETETYTVTSVEPGRVRTEGRSIFPDRSTKVFIARDGWKLGAFSEVWANIHSGDKLTCYYDDYGTLELMAVLPTATASGSHSFVYGVATAVSIPESYTIVKNGAVVDATKLKKYDVVTLDAANRQALVTDARITGHYQSGTPTISYPQSITMYGMTFAISDTAALSFADLELDHEITLLFNTEGTVIAAFPKNKVSAEMQGVVTALKDGKATITLFSGLTLRDIKVDGIDLGSMMGRAVTIASAKDGTARLSKRSMGTKISGDWTIADGQLGSRLVSPQVKVYEEVLSGAPLCAIEKANIVQATIPSKQIRYTVTDSAGTITNIVLGDVTGDSWVYGLAYTEKRGSDEDITYYVRVKYWNGSAMEQMVYQVDDLSDTVGGIPVGIPKGYSTTEGVINSGFATQKLKLVDTVDVEAFDGAGGVQTDDGYYALADDIGAYVESRDEFIPLQSAKSNYSSFRLYANTSATDGSRIRMIVVS